MKLYQVTREWYANNGLGPRKIQRHIVKANDSIEACEKIRHLPHCSWLVVEEI